MSIDSQFYRALGFFLPGFCHDLTNSITVGKTISSLMAYQAIPSLTSIIPEKDLPEVIDFLNSHHLIDKKTTWIEGAFQDLPQLVPQTEKYSTPSISLKIGLNTHAWLQDLKDQFTHIDEALSQVISLHELLHALSKFPNFSFETVLSLEHRFKLFTQATFRKNQFSLQIKTSFEESHVSAQLLTVQLLLVISHTLMSRNLAEPENPKQWTLNWKHSKTEHSLSFTPSSPLTTPLFSSETLKQLQNTFQLKSCFTEENGHLHFVFEN